MEKNIINYHRYKDSRGRSYYGADQVAASVKIDSGNWAALEAEMTASGIKRNRIINLAIKWYLKELDEARREAMYEQQLGKYILNLDTEQFTTGELEKLEHISRGMGVTKERVCEGAIRRFLEDYDKNPFKYMP